MLYIPNQPTSAIFSLASTGICSYTINSTYMLYVPNHPTSVVVFSFASTGICSYTSTYYILLTIYYVVITDSKSMDQPGKVANPGHSQLNRENEYFPVPVCAREFSLARPIRQSRPASACSSPYSGSTWCLLTGFLPASATASIYLSKPP